jgi:hypothetical protein
MKRALAAAAVALTVTAQTAQATPSTVVWTPATTYTQPFLVPHITYDTYVARDAFLQNDYGLTLGVSPSSKLQAEVGFDLLLPALFDGGGNRTSVGDNFYLNGKVTAPEGAFAKWQPGVSLGIQSVGFKSDYSDYHLVHLDVGKAFKLGTVAIGGYYGLGSDVLWSNAQGDVNRTGFMASYTSPDFVIDRPGLQKVVFSADVATGENYFGAVGGAVALYFTPSVSLLTGPVWFMERDVADALYGGDFVWTFQLDVDFDLRKPKK